jgi:hypothetical protein
LPEHDVNELDQPLKNFNNRKKLEKKFLNNIIHYLFLILYLENKLIPKSLRVDLSNICSLQDHNLDRDLKDIAHNTSTKIIETHRDFFKKSFTSLLDQIKIRGTFSIEQIKKIKKNYNNTIMSTILRKKKKIIRDGGSQNLSNSFSHEFCISKIENILFSEPKIGERNNITVDMISLYCDDEKLDPLDSSSTESEIHTSVVNMSKLDLTKYDISLLNRGLKFCPNSLPNKFQIHRDLYELERKLRCMEYFATHPYSNNFSITKQLGEKSSFCPPLSLDSPIPNFMNNIKKHVDLHLVKLKERKTGRPKYNLSYGEFQALKNLEKNSDIIIKPADKGGAIVILDRTMYIEKALEHLSDKNIYKKISLEQLENSNNTCNQKLEECFEELRTIDKKLPDFVKNNFPRISQIYFLPKIHKTNTPFRPIVSSNDCITENISKLISFAIKEIPKKLPSYLKDTNHFLELIRSTDIPKNSKIKLVTADVSALYTNIPHADNIESCIHNYRSLLEDSEKILSPETLTLLIDLVLNFNMFQFGDSYFHQINGVAMGTRCAPDLANIFMGSLQEKFEKTVERPFLSKRFLDDLFMIFLNKTDEEIHEYMSKLNNVHESINLTYEISEKEINFLDVTVVIEGDTIYTKAYRKPTDKPQYLHFSSNHPHHTKTSLPYSLALRYKRICSRQTHLNENLIRLKNTFLEKSYPEKLLDDAINKAINIETIEEENLNNGNNTKNTSTSYSEKEAEKEKEKENSGEVDVENNGGNNTIRFITTHSASNPQFRQILTNSLPILQSHDSEVFQNIEIDTTFRRAKSIRDKLVHSTLNHIQPQKNIMNIGMKKCERPRCKCCAQLYITNIAKSTSSEYEFHLRSEFDCTTRNCVYLLECGICALQYVGETEQPFNKRLNGHRSDSNQNLSTKTGKIIGKPDLPIFKHIKNTGHKFEDFKVIILKSDFSNDNDRLFYESFSISMFDTFRNGLNENCGVYKFSTRT